MTATATPTRDAPDSAPAAKAVKPELRRILQLSVPVIVKLAERKMRMNDVMQLSAGSIIEFDKLAEEPLDLMVNNVRIGAGEVVKVSENFGLRLIAIGDARDKIQALGGGEPASAAGPDAATSEAPDTPDAPDAPSADAPSADASDAPTE